MRVVSFYKSPLNPCRECASIVRYIRSDACVDCSKRKRKESMGAAVDRYRNRKLAEIPSLDTKGQTQRERETRIMKGVCYDNMTGVIWS